MKGSAQIEVIGFARYALISGDEAFLEWFNKVFEYTFKTFPGREPEIRDWIQIRTRHEILF